MVSFILMSYSKSSSPSHIINHLIIFIILILGIIAGVRLIEQPETLTSQAKVLPQSQIQVISSSSSQVVLSRDVKLKITYAGGPTKPSYFRLANSLDDLAYARLQQFISNGEEISWRLSAGNGQKTVYLQFEVGNDWLPSLSTQVTLNMSPGSGFLVGATIPSLIDYPYNDILAYSHATDTEADLKALKAINGSLIRVYVPYDKISNAEASKRLSDFLTQAAANNIKVIPVLIDDYASSHNPLGADQYYTASSSGVSSLNHDFFKSGYKNEYLSLVKQVVADNKDNPSIYAWEIGSDLKDPTSTQTFLNFMQDVSSTIKGLDPLHDIIGGISSTADIGLTPLQFYTTLPDIDIVSIHSTNMDHQGQPDAIWARQNFHPSLVEVESLSATRGDDRSIQLAQEISYWKNLGVSGLLMPNFVAKGLKDNGDGSKTDGMDAIFHGDYDNLAEILKSSVQ